MMNYSIFVALVTSSLILLTLEPEVDANSPDKVRESVILLCKNEQSLKLNKISQVKEIVHFLKTNLDSAQPCEQDLIDSTLDIERVISRDLDDVCTLKKVDQIREYHSRYIAYSSKDELLIAEPLKRFFIGFALQVSSICKKTMINSLILDTQQLTPEDSRTIEIWTNKNNGLVQDAGFGPEDFDDLLLLKDLDELSGESSANDEKVFIQTGSVAMLNEIRLSCNRRFKPIYSRLILPLVELSNLGFDYQGEDLERELELLKHDELVAKWYKIAYLCETLDDVVLVEESADRIATEGLEKNLIRILTEEEASQLGVLPEVQSVYRFEPEPEQNSFGIPIGDLVIDDSDENFGKLINTFDSQRSRLERIRKKMLIKVGQFLKNSLLKGKINIVDSMFNRREGQSKALLAEQRRNAITAIDNYVQQVNSSTIDKPVSGLTDYGRRAYHNGRFVVAHRGNYPGAAEEVRKKRHSLGKIIYRTLAVILFIVGVALAVSTIAG